MEKYYSMVIAFPNTDIFVAAPHFNKLKHLNLEELWFVPGQSDFRTVFSIHNFPIDSSCITNNLYLDLQEALPAIHGLTGRVTTSQAGCKSRVMKEGASNGYKLLYYFDGTKLSEQMINDAEKFLFKCITKHDVDSFNELFIMYHEKHLQFHM